MTRIDMDSRIVLVSKWEAQPAPWQRPRRTSPDPVDLMALRHHPVGAKGLKGSIRELAIYIFPILHILWPLWHNHNILFAIIHPKIKHVHAWYGIDSRRTVRLERARNSVTISTCTAAYKKTLCNHTWYWTRTVSEHRIWINSPHSRAWINSDHKTLLWILNDIEYYRMISYGTFSEPTSSDGFRGGSRFR